MAGHWRVFSGDAWRVDSREHVGKPLAADHTSTRPGRWNGPGEYCLYLNANHVAVMANARVAVLEARRKRAQRELPHPLIDEILDGNALGLVWVREVGVSPLRVADVRSGPAASSWGLPSSYPLMTGCLPGPGPAQDRVVCLADCQALAGRVKATGVPAGVWCTSAALNGHAAARGAEEICELDPAVVREPSGDEVRKGPCAQHNALPYPDWANKHGADPSVFDVVD